LQIQNMFKKSEKKSQHTSMLYIQRQKFATSNSTYIWRDKKINLSVNSVKYYSIRSDTIHNRICLFCFSKCRSDFKLKFLGVVDTTYMHVVYYFQIFSPVQSMFFLG
jgi:hypothetical protein